MAEVEETLKRIQAHKGVIGTVVINAEDYSRQEIKSPHVLFKLPHPHKAVEYVATLKPTDKASAGILVLAYHLEIFQHRMPDVSTRESVLHEDEFKVPRGIPIRTTLDNSTSVQYAGLLHQLTMKARRIVRDIDPQNDLTFLRIRSKKHEIMVAPDKDYLLIVIQNPCE